MLPQDLGSFAGEDDNQTRARRLTEVIDWAEAEAAALDAPDAGMCLQLARLALRSRKSD